MSRARTDRVARAAQLAAGLVAGVVLLSGCGTDGATASDPAPSPSASDSPEPATSPTGTATPDPGAEAPSCRSVWKADARLPRGYKGCNEGTGASATFVPREALDCSSGQRIVTYDDHFYAVPGGTVHRTESRLEKDRGYREAVARCRG